jgi:hypothetical protein
MAPVVQDPINAQPTQDPICNVHGRFCNIGWMEHGEELQYWIVNDQDLMVTKDVTLQTVQLMVKMTLLVQLQCIPLFHANAIRTAIKKRETPKPILRESSGFDINR